MLFKIVLLFINLMDSFGIIDIRKASIFYIEDVFNIKTCS